MFGSGHFSRFIVAAAATLTVLSQTARADSRALASSTNNYSVILAKSDGANQTASRLEGHVDLKGWDHLFALLVDEGVEPDELVRLFSDSRMPPRENLIFALEPRESHALYRKHNSAAARRNAMGFYREHEETFRTAETQYHVPRSLILSLLQIETACGTFTGNDRVFFRLARLAAAASPDNVEENFVQKKRSFRLLSFDLVKRRAEALQDIFLKHTAATVGVARSLGVHPLELRGSGAGAIGVPQFLPGNIQKFGVDGNHDGQINVFNPDDSIVSVANFLSSFGWNMLKKMTAADKREILKNYNRSEPYVSTALAMSQALDKELAKQPRP